MNEQIKKHFLSGVIQRLNENSAILKLNNGEEITLPKENIFPGAKEGEAVNLLVFPDGESMAEREALAKAILNELLRPIKDT